MGILYIWGCSNRERGGGEKFFLGFKYGGQHLLEVSNMGARTFFEEKKVGTRTFLACEKGGGASSSF